ncbi:hypothetical protein MTO96_015279 [Rhipicephalus appendiculatus]
MATFNSLQDDLVLCPYSQHHKVKRGRLNIHISKCRRDLRRRRLKPCPFNPDHDAPAEPEEYRQHLATCPDRTSKLLCTATRDDPPYEVPAPGGAKPFIHEPEEEWVVEPGRRIDPFKPAVPPIFRTVTGLKPAERRRYYQSLSANGPPVVYVPGRYPQTSSVPATKQNCNTRGLGKGDSADEEEHWDQAPKLESRAVRPPVFRPIQIGQPHSHQATQAQTSSLGTNQAVQPKTSQPCSTQAEASRPSGVQETQAQKTGRLCVVPQADHAKPSQPYGAQALATRQQSNQASQSCAGQATQDQSGHPRTAKAEAVKPPALQATQPLTGHPKPLLAVQTEAVTSEYRGTWDQARVGQPCGAEATHLTGNLWAARASAKQPRAVQTLTTQDQSALPAPGAVDVDALARRLMGLGSTRQHQSYD